MLAGSLFSSVGGLDLGLHRAGFTHAFFCESDPWRRDILRSHWPGVPVHDDVQGFTEPPALEEGLGLLCGGFPCQDLSVAGQRRGLAGGRSGLFFEFARITESFRPRWVLIENVPGLLSSNGGRDFGTVLGTMADLGYGLAWRILDSRYFGVPQRRRRVFIIGTLADGDPRAAAERAGQVLAVGTRCPGHPPQGTQAGEDVAGTLGGGSGGRGWAQDTERMTFVAAPLSHGSNPNSNMAGRRREDDANLVTAFSHTQGLDAQPSTEAWPSLRNGGGGHAVASTGVRRLTPVECERLQGWPDNWTNPDGTAPDSRRYAACGDGVTAPVGEWLGRRILAHA